MVFFFENTTWRNKFRRYLSEHGCALTKPTKRRRRGEHCDRRECGEEQKCGEERPEHIGFEARIVVAQAEVTVEV